MTRTGTAAQNYALAQVGKTIKAGQCLLNVRTWFGLAAKYPTAIAAWNGAQFKHTDRPTGSAVVPVWFKSASPARHVALRISDGTVITVNGTKVSHFASIDAVAAAGFGAYMGWAEDLNGVRIYTSAPVHRDITALQRAVRAETDNIWGPDTAKRLDAVHKAISGAFPYGVQFAQSAVGTVQDGAWGPKSKSALNATIQGIQAAVGTTPDGIWGPKTQAALDAAHNASNHTV